MHLAFRSIIPALAVPLLAWQLWVPASAAIDQASAHYIARNWNFQQCRRQVQAALRAERMTVVEEGANTGDFRGYSDVRRDASGSLDTAVINCWSTSGGMRITFACASQTPNNDAVAMCNRMIATVFGRPADATACASPVGSWNWWNGGTVTFAANGTATHPSGATGQWVPTSGGFHVHWGPPLNSDDYFTISADGTRMIGDYSGTTGTSTRQGSC